MSLLSDELLNKYIDGELDSNTAEEVRLQLLKSGEAQKRYNALVKVHSSLKNLPAEEVREDFTQMLIQKLQKSFRTRKSDRIFIISVSSIFTILSFGIISLAAYLIISAGSESESTGILAQFFSLFNSLGGILAGLTSAKIMSIIGFIFSFGIIISAYFFFENQKNSRRRLKKL
jgi:ABC-type bacteriocin/lantibiotic exporter with double-glycine peptidase domain